VQAGRHTGRAAREARCHPSDHRAGRHPLASVDQHDDRLVRGPQPARVVDADHAGPGDPAGEVHDPGAGRVHRLRGGRGEDHATLAGQPGARGRVERRQHAWAAGQRPAVADGHGDPGTGHDRRHAG
jgi:hypothetical protein